MLCVLRTTFGVRFTRPGKRPKVLGTPYCLLMLPPSSLKPYRSLLLPKPLNTWPEAFFLLYEKRPFTSSLWYRRSGSNRHGAFAPPDFESSLLHSELFC